MIPIYQCKNADCNNSWEGSTLPELAAVLVEEVFPHPQVFDSQIKAMKKGFTTIAYEYEKCPKCQTRGKIIGIKNKAIRRAFTNSR